MNKLFSIGEVSKIMAISAQSLRAYCNMGLIQPEYVNTETGYRYFSSKQFHYIDKIKHLRKLGVSLQDIQTAMAAQNSKEFVSLLSEHRKEIDAQRKSLEQISKNLDWYIEYFSFSNRYSANNHTYIRTFPDRYALGIPCGAVDKAVSVELELSRLRYSEHAQVFHYLRQYGYTASFDALQNGQFVPNNHYMFLQFKPKTIDPCIEPYVLTFPAGEYLCFNEEIRSPEWDGAQLKEKLSGIGPTSLVLANEFEKNLSEYGIYSLYEFQILMND